MSTSEILQAKKGSGILTSMLRAILVRNAARTEDGKAVLVNLGHCVFSQAGPTVRVAAGHHTSEVVALMLLEAYATVEEGRLGVPEMLKLLRELPVLLIIGLL